MFLPSQSTALLALEVSPWLALDVTARRALRRQQKAHLDPQTNCVEGKWTEGDLKQACSVLGEQIIGLLAMMTRRHACREEGLQLLIIDPRGEFGIPFENFIASNLQFSRSHPRYGDVMLSLAHDFRAWVAAQPPELMPLGLNDNGSDGIVVTCKALTPVLIALPD